MSKAMKKDAPRQDRRARVLRHFKIRPQRRDESAEDYEAYVERKEVERATLQRLIGTP